MTDDGMINDGCKDCIYWDFDIGICSVDCACLDNIGDDDE